MLDTQTKLIKNFVKYSVLQRLQYISKHTAYLKQVIFSKGDLGNCHVRQEVD